MNKKGFTLAELLAVIVVLAIVIGIGMTSAINVMNKGKIKLYEEMTDNLKDAAITCYQHEESADRASRCYTPEDLVKYGYFEDKKEYCLNKDIKITEINWDEEDEVYKVTINKNCSQ